MSPKRGSGRTNRQPPERTCVACHAVRPKRQLIRIVRGPDGRVQVDATGRQPGRGAYLCRQHGCWEQALQRSALERALKSALSPEDRLSLGTYATTLPEQLSEVSAGPLS